MSKLNVLFIYELKHVEEISSFFVAHPDIHEEDCLIISLDAGIEYALVEKKVPFISGREYRTPDATPMILAEEWPRTLFNSEQWAFFHYRKVVLSLVYFSHLQTYLTPLLYYADIVANVLSRHSATVRCIVFSPAGIAPVRGFSLAGHRMKVVIDVVTCLSSQRGIEVLIPERVVLMLARTSAASFASKRMLFSWGISFLNALIIVLRRPRRVRILASDYWRNLSPYLKKFGSVEVVLLDRMQAFNAGLSNIWRFRMRFLNMDTFDDANEFMREEEQKRINRDWQSIRGGSAMPECLFQGFSLRSLMLQALDTIVAEASSRTLEDIDDAYTLCMRLKPDVIELRSSMTSAQTHFVILAQVARALNIPSVDMQQGIEYYGPGSMSKRHSAQYMAVYGLRTQKELKNVGDTVTPIVIGSPRFDVYEPLSRVDPTSSIPHTGFSVLCIAPSVALNLGIDAYDVEEYFRSIGAALREISHASAIIKIRASPVLESFYRNTIASAFSGVSHTIAQSEPLWNLYPQADVVISYYSTAVLEALQCAKPLVYLGLSPGQRMMAEHQFEPYVKSGAMCTAYTGQDLKNVLNDLSQNSSLRQKMSDNAEEFCKQEYAFDGKASERAVAFITSVASSASARSE